MSAPAVARVVICCGSGGVGKTTTSAALAIHLARAGHKVAVLTIDPARRLADALSVGDIGNVAFRVPLPSDCTGSLDAMMLDAKRTFDGIIERFAGSPEVRDRILRNHYYQHVSARLAGAHEYMAMEKLYELATSGAYDIIVLDTPPARHALDFLAAPDRMARLMDEGVMRWLVLPASQGGWRMIEKGSEILAGILQRMLGDRTISDIADFFTAFQGLWAGFRERSLGLRALLTSRDTRFLLVTTPAPTARAEALHFLDVLKRSHMPFGGFLLNRCLEPVPDTTGAAFPPAPAGVDPAAYAALLTGVRAAPLWRQRLVATQEAAITDLRRHAPTDAPIWRIPDFEAELHDVEALQRMQPYLPEPGSIWKK